MRQPTSWRLMRDAAPGRADSSLSLNSLKQTLANHCHQTRAFAGRLLIALPLTTALLPWTLQAAPVDDAIRTVQHDWEVIRYQSPAASQVNRLEALSSKAHAITAAFPQESQALIWEGIVLSTLAGERGGLGALSLAKQARALFEQAIAIDGTALDGSAYASLAVLYYKLPGWPVSFGNKREAEALLQRALALNPRGIDPNFFYAELLAETGRTTEATTYAQRALQAEPRPGRQVADAGRREEVRALLQRLETAQVSTAR